MTIRMLFWGWLWGIMGLLLAVPLTAFVKLIADSPFAYSSLKPPYRRSSSHSTMARFGEYYDAKGETLFEGEDLSKTER